MLADIFSKFGSQIGKHYGGGILSSIGKSAGKLLGEHLDKIWFGKKETAQKFTNIKDSFHVAKAQYGSPIPLVFGRMKVEGQIIWADRIMERHNISSTSKYFKKQNKTLTEETIKSEYYINFAVAICEGEIAEIGRVWVGTESIELGNYNVRIYKGDEDQLPDPLIASLRKGPAPAYRGLAYVVFENLPLADFGDNIPCFSFEITRKTNIKQNASTEDLVRSITMIPGSGEYVYDTKIQYKHDLSQFGHVISSKAINSHNHYKIANSINSLNQLQTTCQNIKWIAPVACWFGDNIDARYCKIKAGVEFNDSNIGYSEEWKVGKYNRQNAYLINRDEHNNPLYGGSVNDTSVTRYLQELKSRNMNIMFYPMFLLDVERKPWRGRVTSSPEYIKDFFNKEHGYNDFIIHYARLVKDHADAFVIGSELIGLTKVKNNNNFPAVNELIKLAKKVKQIVGERVMVTYAADWSEYHHTDGGWFNLDPLWASPNIDFIGIDAYFPVTDSISSTITPEEIANGWRSGEGYDYYINHSDNSKHYLSPAYAWKNIRYWWENIHTNPDGQTTPWQPRSKQIWFTEFGFPSIDKATNQPNVFFDPKCIDGGMPKRSRGTTDFSIQRKAIRAFIEYWQQQEYIGESFLWTWDARPYPAWPYSTFWGDGNLWEKGHWVNNKFGTSNLASIILEISQKCGIDISNIDVSTVDETIEGLFFNNQITALNAINTLRTSHFFDICANNKEFISFIKRGYKKERVLNSQNCLKLSDNNFVEIIDIPEERILGKIDLYFIDRNTEFESNYIYVNNETNSFITRALVRLPLLITESQANNIAYLILKNAAIEKRIIRFKLSSIDFALKPSDFAVFQHHKSKYYIRIIDTEIGHNHICVIGVIDDRASYLQVLHSKDNINFNYSDSNTKLMILDLPFSFEETSTPYLGIYLRNNCNAPLYTKFPNELEDKWHNIANLKTSNAIGKVISFNHSDSANIFIIDRDSEIIVSGINLEKYISNNWQYASVGNELIGFKNLEKIDKNLYKISSLTRGEMGTEEFMNHHEPNENFAIIVRSEINIIAVSKKLENKLVEFKSCNIEKPLTYTNKAQQILAPYITRKTVANDTLHLEWITRIKNNTGWESEAQIVPAEFVITIKDGQQIHEQKTQQNYIIINISELALSDDYQLSIITNYKF